MSCNVATDMLLRFAYLHLGFRDRLSIIMRSAIDLCGFCRKYDLVQCLVVIVILP